MPEPQGHLGNGHVHPTVHYEKSDADVNAVFWSGVAFAVFVFVVPLFIIPLYFFLLRQERPRKETDLPPSAVEVNRLPPEPRLEAIDDLRDPKDRRYVFLPRRAQDLTAAQKKLLEDGEKSATGTDQKLPIDTPDGKEGAIQQLADQLPSSGAPPPDSFLQRLPSKASSGWRSSGGQP